MRTKKQKTEIAQPTAVPAPQAPPEAPKQQNCC